MSFRSPTHARGPARAHIVAVLAVAGILGTAASGPAAHAGLGHDADADLQPEQLQPCLIYEDRSYTPIPGCRRVSTPYIWVKAFDSNSWRLDCGGHEPYNRGQPSFNNHFVLPDTGYDYSASSKWVSLLAPFARWSSGEPDDPGFMVLRAQNLDPRNGHHWDYAIGCAPSFQATTDVRRPRPPAVVSRELTLPPQRLTTVRRSCPRGTRVVDADHAVGWLRKSRNPDDEVQVVQSRRGRTVTWRFFTANFRRGNVRAQTHLTCSRR